MITEQEKEKFYQYMLEVRKENFISTGLSGGKLPLGYKRGASGHIELDETYVPEIKAVMRLLASGLNGMALVRVMHNSGFPYFTRARLLNYLRHQDLYTKGKRVAFGGVEAKEMWPIIAEASC